MGAAAALEEGEVQPARLSTAEGPPRSRLRRARVKQPALGFSSELGPQAPLFSVVLVAHTQQCIVLPTRKIGDGINIEATREGRRRVEWRACFLSRDPNHGDSVP